MATLTLTDLDKELLDGLQVLTDQEMGRVQAHLAAGLPMKIEFGWALGDWDEKPACFGCIVGTVMGGAFLWDATNPRRRRLVALAYDAFPDWARDRQGWRAKDDNVNHIALSTATLTRLAALLDMEWSRRHPVPAESTPGISASPAESPLIKEGVLV